MVYELTATNVLTLSSIIIISIAVLYIIKSLRMLFMDEFTQIIHWILTVTESFFIIQLIIFFAFYFNLEMNSLSIIFGALSIFISLMFLFTSLKILKFIRIYEFKQ
ncbi:MAG: hypothetical protein JW703_02530 [Candidatus Diapherotrites archaeon]|nr:hypothetical protein [Candidatus Diapherotrites archaeon]